jgi:nitric oxide reductase subunit B
MGTKKLWIWLILVMGISFFILSFFGHEIYVKAPPIPDKIVTTDGTVLFTGQDIKDGQNVWQSLGGQEVGTIWGHGAYVAPDWSADWLHRESLFILNKWSEDEFKSEFENLSEENKAVLKVRLSKELRSNTYDESKKVLTVSPLRAMAIKETGKYYTGLFMNDPEREKERTTYSIPPNSIKDISRMELMNDFFFWTAWACVTNRPGDDISYTNNWPGDKLVGNKPSVSLIFWTGFSVILLLVGIGILAFYYAKDKKDDELPITFPKDDPLTGFNPTPSMLATQKYFWVVCGLILFQVLLGAITAHYGVEGNSFYGLSLSNILPYSVSRTWHVQLGILWIATSWLATGLYIAPAVSGYEPKFQRFGVNFLFIALLIIVVGSLIGQWMGIMQKLGLVSNFWFGHQGYEYVDLGRFWQIFLFVGLIIWLFLLIRALKPALKNAGDNKQLLSMFIMASVAIALFYGAGLMWGRQTNLSIAEYWRWWVVHLWVEGFFEVFATVVSAFLFVRMGLLKIKTATFTVLFTTIVFLSGGIIGTFHHLYFTGTPTAVVALGASFSALEVVPLVFMGFEVYHNLKVSRTTDWVKAYKWPIYCFISVAVWNFIGAGVFGFLINPPIALYFMQGLNTTPVHGHAALFGVYGMLGIGLMLFVLKGLTPKYKWKDSVIRFAFWSINIGLVLMIILSMLPLGIYQTIASIRSGMWYARSADFMQNPWIEKVRWMRVVGDTVFAIGTVALTYFVIGLKTGWSIDKSEKDIKDN